MGDRPPILHDDMSAHPIDLEAAVGALLGTFVGDALGIPFEGKPALGDRRASGDGGRLARPPDYTDETQMIGAAFLRRWPESKRHRRPRVVVSPPAA
jgi:ADP-ribosylglycohydrolase